MKLLIDYADIEVIKRIYEYYPCAGVTTNPSILAKTGEKPYDVLLKIRQYIGDKAELHAQVISAEAENMVIEGQRICEVLGKETFVKVPVTQEGIKAIKLLSAKGYQVTATAVYTSMQAYLAGQAGAAYAAPYVNRIDNMGTDGVKTAKDIHDIFRANGLCTQVLAASFKNTQQVLELAKYGVGAATVGPDVIDGFLKLDAVEHAVKQFTDDFELLCGEGKTMM